MKILYLYTEAMGYTLATIKALIDSGADVHMVHHDHAKLTPYVIATLPGLTVYKRSEMSHADLCQLAAQLLPDLTLISGWVDKGYLEVAKSIRTKGGIVVTGLDNPWRGTLRQYGAGLLGHFGYLDRYFSYVWVAGAYQYEFARRLGFARDRIVFDMYSADLALFHAAYVNARSSKARRYPHRFLYVGRFADVKGLDVLVSAWRLIESVRDDWELHLIGNGPLRDTIPEVAGVVIKDFMQPEHLMAEVAQAGCFVLPSRKEPWGVVVHEFCAAGLPLILSDVVGAGVSFLVPGFNGYRFGSGDSVALADNLRRIISSTRNELVLMSERSHQLSYRITPQTSAGNLLSCANMACL